MLEKDHIYSFSQLQSFSECPYSFYLERIERRKSEMVNNAFASQGTLIHDLLDQWAKGKLTKQELPDEYARRYPNEVVESWPRMLAAKGYATKAFNIGLEYFKNFDEFKGYKIISTEEKFETTIPITVQTEIDGEIVETIENRKFVGVMDMLMEDEKTKELIVLDHKSKSLSAFKKAENEMYRQQYLYSKFVFEKYNRYPDRLMFNLFKENGEKKERLFTKEGYVESLHWAEEQIKRIEEMDFIDWLQTKEIPEGKIDFFCSELCSCRKICPNGTAKRPSKR